ncbi:MAG: protein translocase subunit SecD [Candidatus Orphnella occulta]|nr:protein translocase subunit SecD [Candidatus Orphnella occulta]MDP8296568.1 protein translocase subunit SecD [Candidatus Orphnella occulta]
MQKNLKWKTILILVVIGLSIWSLWPPLSVKDKEGNIIREGRINLGLDLQGGMHLVLKVDTSKLTEEEAEDAPDRALEIIRNRVDQFGVKEVSIQRQGTDEMVIQLPGVTDRDRALELIGRTALLEFRLVSSDPEKLKKALAGEIEGGYELLEGENGEKILLEKNVEITGADLTNAFVKFDQSSFNQPTVSIAFNKEGAKKFARITGNNVGTRLAIVLDGNVKSAPVIKERIPSGEGVIQGRFSPEEANDLSIILRAGALPAPVVIEEERTVGPLLGLDSIRSGIKAIVIGAFFVCVFMAVYYLLAGIVSVFALVLNFLIILGVMGYFHFTLTLPGIAGLILTLGMAVDANVLIYERVKEELRTGKTIRSAISTGYSKALSAIIDSNLTTLIAAILLFQFGTGAIRGFAMTLTIGIFASLFTALVVTRTIFQLFALSPNFKTLKMLNWIHDTKIDFIGKRKICYGISLVIVIIGLSIFGSRGERNFGVDFTGGTLQQIQFRNPIDIAKVRSVVSELGLKGASIQEITGGREVLIRTSEDVDVQLNNALKSSITDNSFELMRVERVGPSVGKLLRKNAIRALIFGLLGILVYIGFRFKHWEYGFAGVVALFHDVLIVIVAMAIAGREFDLTAVAAILTVAGYSINDTVVIFDRIRENMRLLRKIKFTDLINLSINQTLGRTVFTTLTTLFTAVALFVWGGVVLNNFAFCLIVGFISGIYSTIFIASPLILLWQKRR